jgi:hypothetical protein
MACSRVNFLMKQHIMAQIHRLWCWGQWECAHEKYEFMVCHPCYASRIHNERNMMMRACFSGLQDLEWLIWCSYRALLDVVEITNKMHKSAPLLYSYMLAPTCFGSSLPSSGSFWIRLLRENTDRYAGLSYDVVKWPVFPVGKHNRLNHETPTHRPLNHIIW